MVDDSIAKFIKSTYIKGTVVGDTYYFDHIVPIVAPTIGVSIPLGSTNVAISNVEFFIEAKRFCAQVRYEYDGKTSTAYFDIKNGKCVSSIGLTVYNAPKLDSKYP